MKSNRLPATAEQRLTFIRIRFLRLTHVLVAKTPKGFRGGNLGSLSKLVNSKFNRLKNISKRLPFVLGRIKAKLGMER
jgi:hypothetical protein